MVKSESQPQGKLFALNALTKTVTWDNKEWDWIFNGQVNFNTMFLIFSWTNQMFE